MTTSDFDNLIATNCLTLSIFYATWCGACRVIEPTLERAASAWGEGLSLVRIDIDERSTRELVRRYNIVSVPTLILFNAGNILWRDSGVIPFERLSLALRSNHLAAEV